MKVTSVTLLPALLMLAGCATGKLGFERCALGTFGGVRCEFTASLSGPGGGIMPTWTTRHSTAYLGSIRRMQICGVREASLVGTRAHRRCQSRAIAAASPPARRRATSFN